jgi:type VI secretion system protein ImpL
MRVLARNTVSRRGDTLRVTIMVGGRDVSYNFQVGTVLNPFFLPALSEFNCPTGL